jgi:two-component system response regulator AtoC
VISSTHRDLPAGIRDGRFREDLYYRLNVFEIRLPPLRERRADIGQLATFFLDRFARELGRSLRLTPDTIQRLEHYDWPGNVRELQNLMERAAVLSDGPEVDPGVFRVLLPAATAPDENPPSPEDLLLEPAVEAVERKLILRALGEAGDNKARAARLLGVSERTLWYKLKRYGL